MEHPPPSQKGNALVESSAVSRFSLMSVLQFHVHAVMSFAVGFSALMLKRFSILLMFGILFLYFLESTAVVATRPCAPPLHNLKYRVVKAGFGASRLWRSW